MKLRVATLALTASAVIGFTVFAQQPASAPQGGAAAGQAPAGGRGGEGGRQGGRNPNAVPAIPGQTNPNGIRVYIRSGLKTHGDGLHDYPQFLADWSKVLTDRGAIVDGSYHSPTAAELEKVDVVVMYKGDAGYMNEKEKADFEAFVKRGGGIVQLHDTLCGPDPAYYSTLVGGAKRHGETNFTLEADIPYTIVDKANPIMQGMSDFTLAKDEAFYSMTWATSPKINVLATAKIAATPTAVNAGHAGEEVPQIWSYEHTMAGGTAPSRAFVWMQGHLYANVTDPRIKPMLLRGIAWAAKRPVNELVDYVQPQRGAGRGRGAQ
jgi:type 1 glutamine amidotransferase